MIINVEIISPYEVFFQLMKVKPNNIEEQLDDFIKNTCGKGYRWKSYKIIKEN